MAEEKNKQYMKIALEEARKASRRGEVPVGAVIVNNYNGEVMASYGNETIARNDPSAHAEMLAIRHVCLEVKAQRVPQMDIYITLEPCPMCAAALSYARINTVCFAASDPKSGGLLQGPRLYDHAEIHHKPKVIQGPYKQESAKLLKDFFRERRKK